MSIEEVEVTEEATAETKPKISDVLDQYTDVIDQIKEHQENISMLTRQKEDFEWSLRRYGEETGLDKFQTDRISVTLGDKQVAKFEPDSWDKILQWCLDNNLTDVVQRRLTPTKLQSLAEDGVAFPDGLSLETIDKVSYRRKAPDNG